MSFNIFSISVLFALSLSLGLSEEYTFTNKSDKRQLTASIIGIVAGKVSAEKDGGKIQIPIANLIDEDVTFLKEWLKRNPSYALRVAVKNRKGIPEQSDELKLKNLQKSRYQAKTTSIESEYYHLSITNDSNVDLEGAKLEYKIYIKTNKSSAFSKNSSAIATEYGVIEVPKVPVGTTVHLSTKEVSLENTALPEYKTSYYTVVDADGNSTRHVSRRVRKNRVRPDVKGIWLRVSVDGKLIKEIKDIEDAIKNEVTEWKDRPRK